VLTNDGAVEDLRRQVDRLYAELVRAASVAG
jgi:hypothetical protein